MRSEITAEEEDDDENNSGDDIIIPTGLLKEKIRRIIEYQKSLYHKSSFSSSSSAAFAPSSSAYSTVSKSSTSLMELMKSGNTSLRRLFDMEHTSLANYFDIYSGSPERKTIYLWGSDTDNEYYDPWAFIKQIGEKSSVLKEDEQSNFASGGNSFRNEEQLVYKNSSQTKARNRRLTRKKSFRRLPGFGLWRFRNFRLRLRLKNRLKILICCRKM